MKRLLITSLAVLSSSAIFAQTGSPAGDPTGGFGELPPPPDMVPPPPPEDILDLPDDIFNLHAEVAALRDAIRVERQAIIDALGEEATRDEIVAALNEWRSDPEVIAQIEEMKGLSESLREALEGYLPEREAVEVPEEIKVKREELKDLREGLKGSREEFLSTLAEDATEEEVRAALDEWRAENAGTIELTKALATELRTWFRENRPRRTARAIGQRAIMKARKDAFRENAKAMREAHQELRELLQNPDLTPEEKRALIREFKASQRDLLMERKQLKRAARDIGDGEGGGRRPGG